MLEVELKVRVDDLDAVREKLRGANAVFENALVERDLYLNSPTHDFGKTDEALRLREAGGKYALTYKGSRKQGHALKAREEITCGVESCEAMMQILLALGFRPVAVVKKKREYYRLGNATVTLDTVEDLGKFVEIELDPSARDDPSLILGIAESLGITGESITDSYLELLEKKRVQG